MSVMMWYDMAGAGYDGLCYGGCRVGYGFRGISMLRENPSGNDRDSRRREFLAPGKG